MVDLVAYQLDSTLTGEGVQGFHFAIGDGCAGRMMRAVDQNELGIGVGQALDFIGIDAKTVVAAYVVEASFKTERFRNRGESGESGQGKNDVCSRFGGQPHNQQKSFGGSSYDLDSVCGHTPHLGDSITKSVRSSDATIDKIVIHEAIAGCIVCEGQDVIDGPYRPGAGTEVEFDAVLVLVEPGIEQEGLESHASTSNVIR